MDELLYLFCLISIHGSSVQIRPINTVLCVWTLSWREFNAVSLKIVSTSGSISSHSLKDGCLFLQKYSEEQLDQRFKEMQLIKQQIAESQDLYTNAAMKSEAEVRTLTDFRSLINKYSSVN